ncbi:MAG: type II toxin-antitoxin system death-on-curing family toxin [Thiofilum sp.]|uniref:type II toxin-antitoxin system death-on-curing family toxin n=1 Tax=Thiofilum sp. TaxID=2212733 RepID=UPI0025FA82B9|nr:type II toxin-antitoxin system death-on-curing family toxin [Thiofilum sp.]MBK8453998.1 type II toxin-antitoxin system death-on-curing family toxin [Thiofilum sp.]
MAYVLLSVEQIEYLHEEVLYDGELSGLAGDKSLASVLARVEHRLTYGLINDVYELAATYATVLAVGHVFNDGNKRTAFTTMNVCLVLNGIDPQFDVIEAADILIEIAQGKKNEQDLAVWLRNRTTNN